MATWEGSSLDQRAAAEQRQRQGKESDPQSRGERKHHHDVLACCSVASGVGPQSGRAASAVASAGPKGLRRSAASVPSGAAASRSIRFGVAPQLFGAAGQRRVSRRGVEPVAFAEAGDLLGLGEGGAHRPAFRLGPGMGPGAQRFSAEPDGAALRCR